VTAAAREAATAALGTEVDGAIDRLRPCDIAVGVLTYNNAPTVPAVVAAAAGGLQRHFPDARAALVHVDAESSDGTPALVAASGLPVVAARHDAPITERVSVPFHGVPGRGTALHLAFEVAHRLEAKALVLLEADAVTATPDWMAALAGPVLAEKADFVAPVYARARYDGSLTKLLLSPLVRALYGRRLQQPFGGQQALSARLLEHLLLHPKWDWRSRGASDLWIVGTAIADGFAVSEAALGPYAVRSATRTTELAAMVAETLGAVLTVMNRHGDLWLEVRGSEPVPRLGAAPPPPEGAAVVDVERMLEGFRLGARDLIPIWEHVLAPETLGEVLSLEVAEAAAFRFPDDLWARTVYDFALAHHYGVVHRDHLLRSLAPLYLGRTAAFVLATRRATAAAVDTHIDGVGLAFEREKPYLVERWR
jgi:hypothetical protein